MGIHSTMLAGSIQEGTLACLTAGRSGWHDSIGYYTFGARHTWDLIFGQETFRHLSRLSASACPPVAWRFAAALPECRTPAR